MPHWGDVRRRLPVLWRELKTDARRSPSLCDAQTLRYNNFDLIRLLMAVLVIFSHSYPIAKGEVFPGTGIPTEPMKRITHGIDLYSAGSR